VTPLDRLLQRLRVRAALPHVPEGARLLDVGCADGHLLRALGPRIRSGVGIDPDLAGAGVSGGRPPDGARYRVVRGAFPDDLDDAGPFDVITMLAVFEHFPDADRPRVVEACRRLLRPGGRVVMTVPAPAVDRIVDLLRALHLAHGMDIEAHHGYRPEQTADHFSGFRVLRHEPFELGLNHLFVLER
jgi:2-polyprenyl-3-methyl-5-hydroxy-6-metoxy-1,4-benzoquinol methylase